MSHNNVWEEHGLYRAFSGEIDGDEIFSSNVAIQADPRFVGIDYVINDFTGITGHSIDASHTRIYADTDNIIALAKGPLKIALLVQGADQLALAENYKALMSASSFDCEVFTDLARARAWVATGTPPRGH